MEKQITLVGVFNIVYRGFWLLGGVILLALAGFLDDLIRELLYHGAIHPHEIPEPALRLIPYILIPVGLLVVLFSTLGIIGSIGLLQRKEWGRILVLIISFINLLHIPVGTILGGYSIWVLMNDETVRLCAAHPAHSA
jgi:hypothetical protein